MRGEEEERSKRIREYFAVGSARGGIAVRTLKIKIFKLVQFRCRIVTEF